MPREPRTAFFEGDLDGSRMSCAIYLSDNGMEFRYQRRRTRKLVYPIQVIRFDPEAREAVAQTFAAFADYDHDAEVSSAIERATRAAEGYALAHRELIASVKHIQSLRLSNPAVPADAEVNLDLLAAELDRMSNEDGVR